VSDPALSARRSFSSLRSCALLMMVFLVAVTAAVAATNRHWRGDDGLVAALAAGGLVSVGMMLALWVTSFAQRDRGAIQYGLGAQLVRLALPAVGALVFQWWSPAMAEAKLFGCVLAIYLPALLVETCLAVRMLGNSPAEVCHG
jgi:hypothetical protein